jgi:hypothetical protein
MQLKANEREVTQNTATSHTFSFMRNHYSMRLLLLILTLQTFSFLQAQDTSFNISRQDTIQLSRLHFKKLSL